jgi:hypothetical protein
MHGISPGKAFLYVAKLCVLDPCCTSRFVRIATEPLDSKKVTLVFAINATQKMGTVASIVSSCTQSSVPSWYVCLMGSTWVLATIDTDVDANLARFSCSTHCSGAYSSAARVFMMLSLNSHP